MPKRKEQIHTAGRPYHVLSRAVEGRGIFESKEDCARFLFQMHAANIGSPAPNLYRRNLEEAADLLLEGKDALEKFVQPQHPPLVEFFSFVLARDHYHFGVVPAVKGGISLYMQKLNLGFAKYFNIKHKRRGSLFETRFQALPIRNSDQLVALTQHINVKNVLDVYQPSWKEKGLHDEESAIRFLKEYPYSSFSDLFMARNSFLISHSGKKELKKFLKEEFLKTKDSYHELFTSYRNKKWDKYADILME